MINGRLKAEILSADNKAYEYQVLLNTAQNQFMQMSDSLSREKQILEIRLKDLHALDENRLRQLEGEQAAESECRIESVELSKLQERLPYLTEVYNKRSAEAKSLETVLVSRRHELDCAIDVLRILRKQRDDRYIELTNLTNRLTESEQHLVELGHLHQETRSRNSLKKRVLVELHSKLDMVTRDYEVVLKQVDQAKGEVGRLTDSVREATQKVSNLTHEKLNRERELARAIESSRRLAILRETTESHHPNHANEIRKLEKKRDLLLERINLLKEGSSCVDQEMHDADKVLNDLESEVTEVINRIATHKEQILSLSEATASCQEEVSGLEIELSGLETQMVSLPGQLMNLKDQSVFLDSQLVELEYHIQLEKKKLESGGNKILTDSEKSSVMERIKSLEAQVESATNLRNRLQTQLGNQRTEIRLMIKECQALQDELDSSTQQVLEAETVVESLEREDECARKSLVDILVFRDKLVADLRDKKNELADMIARVYTSQTELIASQKAITDRNGEQKEKLEELKLVNRELIQERHGLRKQAWDIQHAGKLLTAKLNSQKQKEERAQVPEEDLCGYMEEIERLKEAIENAKAELDQINKAFGPTDGDEKQAILAKLCWEKEQLEAQVLMLEPNEKRPVNVDAGINAWKQLVRETVMKRYPSVYEEFRSELVSLGIE